MISASSKRTGFFCKSGRVFQALALPAIQLTACSEQCSLPQQKLEPADVHPPELNVSLYESVPYPVSFPQ